MATFEPQSALACIVQNNRYLAAIWNTGDWALTGLFGHGRAPLSGMGLAILAGLGCGVVYSRRRLWLVHGLTSPHSGRLFRRQVLLTSLVGAILITSVPNEAYAGTPTYDPVFYYYHPDHLGSCQLMTDRNGEMVQQYGYTPFGEENYQNNTSAFEVSSRYTGQTLDEDTGLYYYGARYYDPELARFIQADSTVPDPEFSQAYNRYAYVYNNPLNLTDPTGQFPWALAAAAMKAMAAFNAVKAVCVAIHTGDYRGLAIGLGVSIIGGAIGGGIGGAIGGNLGSALGSAIGAATFTAAVSGGNVVRAIGEAVVWAYASYYCKLRAAPTTGGGETSVEQKHADELFRLDAQVLPAADTNRQPIMSVANFLAEDDWVPQRTWRDWAWGKLNDAVNWTMEALPSDQNLQRAGKISTTVGVAAAATAAVIVTAGAAAGVTGTALTSEGLLATSVGSAGAATSGVSVLARARALGAAGEAAVRAGQEIGPKIRIIVDGRYRVPDGLTTGVLSEVKNVAYQPWTRQLADYAHFSSGNGLRFDLYIRSTTVISAGVQAAEAAGRVNIQNIPGM